MLGKGLESLIPGSSGGGSNGGNNDPFKKVSPPSDLPFADDSSGFVEEETGDFVPEKNNIEPIKEELVPDNFEPVNIPNQPSPTPVVNTAPPEMKHEEVRREDAIFKKPVKEEKKGEYIFYLEVDKIAPNPSQPRRHFSEDSIRELASSIREFGILQPIVVTKKIKDTENGTEVEYELIAGERRLRAVKLLGLHTIPAIIRNVDLEKERLELAVIENIQRENLNVVEIARSYARLQDEFRMTQREVAAKLGKSRESVANTLRLLDLPVEVQDALGEGRLSESHGRLLLAITDPAAQNKLFKEILERPMTTRELKNRVQVLSHTEKSEQSRNLPPELKMFQERLSSNLGTPVIIEQHGETGKITIRFYSPEELHQIISRLAKEEEF